MGKTIGLISLKGGVGKTSGVIALGSAIADLGKKVLLVDGNLSAPNLGTHLDVMFPKTTIHNVLNRSARPSDAIHKLDSGLDIIPASMFNKINVNPLNLKNRIKSLKNIYDVILLDSSPALNEETLAVMLAADEVFVVTTPDYPTLSTTLKAIKLAQQRGTKIDGLILNKIHGKDFELSFKDIEKTTDVPILATIPFDINILKALSEFMPSTKHKPKSHASEEYKKLAAVLVGEKYKPVKLRNILGWLSPKKQDINRTIFYNSIFG